LPLNSPKGFVFQVRPSANFGLALGYGFDTLALPEIVSFTSATNHRSRAVMERLGMRHDAADDFDYPAMPEGHPLRPHVLYRLDSSAYFGMR
jgi:RimJ/RimL family protein N-acetyltransferase